MNSLYICRESFDAAKVAASCTLGLAIAIAEGRIINGFAIVRPPGHHAEPSQVIPKLLSLTSKANGILLTQ